MPRNRSHDPSGAFGRVASKSAACSGDRPVSKLQPARSVPASGQAARSAITQPQNLTTDCTDEHGWFQVSKAQGTHKKTFGMSLAIFEWLKAQSARREEQSGKS